MSKPSTWPILVVMVAMCRAALANQHSDTNPGVERPVIGAGQHRQQLAANPPSSWKLVRSKAPNNDETFVSIIKTADTLNSDPDLAGLMVRCSKGGKIDVLIALVQPFPPQSRPRITIAADQSTKIFEGKMAAAGAAVILPDEAALLPAGPWQSIPSLSLNIKENDIEIKGMVSLSGLRTAFADLIGSCTQ